MECNSNGGRVFFLVVVLASVLCATLYSADEQSPAEVWKEFVLNKPQGRILTDYQILEGFVLIPTAKKTSDLARCLAAILTYRFGKEPFGSCDFGRSYEFMDALDKRVKALRGSTEFSSLDVSSKAYHLRARAWIDKKMQSARAVNAKAFKGVQKEMLLLKMSKGRKPITLTSGKRKALLMQVYLGRAWGKPAKAIEEFCAHRFLRVTVEKESQPTPANVKEAIDKGVPVLLKRKGGSWAVVMGYIIRGERQEFFLYDPGKTPPKIGTRYDTLSKREKESEVPWIKNYVAYAKRKKMYRDALLSSGASLPAGVAMIGSFAKCQAWYIHTITPDIDKVWPEFFEEIKRANDKKKEKE